MPTYALTDLEESGAAEVGIGVQAAIQTGGGANNFGDQEKVQGKHRRIYRLSIPAPRSAVIYNRQEIHVANDLTPAYLVKQAVQPLDESNASLICDFAMVPTAYDEYNYQAISFPGVAQSSLYTPRDFLFRAPPSRSARRVRINHVWYLGQPAGHPDLHEIQRDRPVRKPNQCDHGPDNPVADEYISMANGRQEIVVDSSPIPWMGGHLGMPPPSPCAKE